MQVTTATVRSASRARAVPDVTRRPGLAETLRSELTKIRSVRSTYWTLIAQVVMSVAWAIADCAGTVAHWSQQPAAGFDAAQASLLGQVELGEVIIMVLGALVMTSEYSTGMIRTSLAVMPRRGVLYAAKALVFAAVSFAVSLVASFAAFFTGQAILAGQHIGTTLAQPDVLRAVLLSVAVVTVFGLFAYGAGALIRHTAGAITSILGVLFLLPVLGRALPASWYNEIVRWLPGGTALGRIASSAPPHAAAWPSLFSAWGEFTVFCGYAAVLVAGSAIVFVGNPATLPAILALVAAVAARRRFPVLAYVTVAVMGSQLPSSLQFGRLAPASILVAVLWLAGIFLLGKSRGHLPWQEAGEAPDNQQPPRGHARQVKNQHATARKVSTTRAGLIFAIAAAATLAAGYALEQSGDQIAGHTGLTGVLFGSTVLAAATSLPELSTGITSMRLGDTQLAMSDIFGGNAFLPVLFLVATLIAGQPVLPQARSTDIYLTGLGILLTAVYVFGLIFRPRRSVARMGPDSLSVLGLYGLGIAGLIAIAT